MFDFLMLLLLFTCKALILFALLLLMLFILIMLCSHVGATKSAGKLVVENLNKQYSDMAKLIYENILTKKQLKQWERHTKKTAIDNQRKDTVTPHTQNIFVLKFWGDLKATAVENLRKEITALLKIATPNDAVLLILNSAGGVIHGYGLATAQLMRIRAKNIPLTIAIDKMAASGGYMMACVANRILAAPFALIGSIGVIVQLPNFHRFLQNKYIDFEQHTAGEYKRTITVFGKNTTAQRKKLQEELNEMHQLFKQLIARYRPFVAIDQVATGEYWLGQQALNLRLVDTIQTSDDYLLECAEKANVYAISYKTKRSWSTKLVNSAYKIYKKIGLSLLQMNPYGS